MKSQTAPPAIFWMLAAFLMLWSLADLVVFVLDVFVNNTSSLGMNMPRWYVIVLAFSVLMSTLSSICLLWRRKSAYLFAILAFIAGGTHHAYTDHGEAFCLLNDQAIAARYLQHHGHADKILIVDLDVHQGNGTAEIFAGDDSVFTFSMPGTY